MNSSKKLDVIPDLQSSFLNQPTHVRGLGVNESTALIISMRKVDKTWVIVSRYEDDIWLPKNPTTNTSRGDTKLDFRSIPTAFRNEVKATMYRMMRRGREGKKRPGASHLVNILCGTKYFLVYVEKLGIHSLAGITPLVCSAYVQYCRTLTTERNGKKKLQADGSESFLSGHALTGRFLSIELLYELSQFTDAPMPQHPWPETSAHHLSGYGKYRQEEEKKTPLIPDEHFCVLFQRAWSIVGKADWLLDLRDVSDRVKIESEGFSKPTLHLRRKIAIEALGWRGTYSKLVRDTLEIRTACYVVIASLSGCRNHELAYLHTNASYSIEGDEGELYWWMRSKSTKTDEGHTEWMIPEAAVSALKIMDRWAIPYQAALHQELKEIRSTDPKNIRIAEALDHVDAIFVGADKANNNRIGTLQGKQWNLQLKAFAKACGLKWNLSSHQFRRKFANYAARSQFGDLRYLKEHFKHWSMDMTLGYAMNESQEMALYLEIQDELEDIRDKVVAQWLDKSVPLAGGYGNNIINWRTREQNVTLFKSHAHMIRSVAQSTAIRSNGHAWCTADERKCDGNDLEKTRCGNGCNNAVIGQQHVPIYQGLYNQLKEISECKDIGPGGQGRVQRDLERCRIVFKQLGHDPERPIT